MTVQPTEQCVQIFLRMVTGEPCAGGGPASALRTLISGIAPTVARPAGGETGAAQEGTAVETATGLVAERGGEIAAPRLRSVLLISTVFLPQLG